MASAKEWSPRQQPLAISKMLGYDLYKARDFCGLVLEDVNDHWVAHTLWSLNMGDVDLACDFIRFEGELSKRGELTRDLRNRRDNLLDRFDEARKLTE